MGIEYNITTGTTSEFLDPPAPPLTLDDQLTAIERTFETKKSALASQLSTVVLIDGAAQAAKTTELQAAYVAACNEKAAAIDALLFGGL